MKYIFSLLIALICFSSNAQSNQKKTTTDSLKVMIFVQFLVTKEGEVKKVKIPLVEGDKISKEALKLLKSKAMNEVLTIKNFDPSETDQLYRMPFSFVFPSDYDFSKLKE
jgi:hypothetical protein